MSQSLAVGIANHARRDGSMKRGSLVDSAIQNVVKSQASSFRRGVPHLLMDDIQMRLLGVMYGVLYARGALPCTHLFFLHFFQWIKLS